MLRIWGREDSLSVQKVMWCVRELGIPFEQINAGRHHEIISEPWYLQINPNGTIPTIDDDGFVLWKSNAILKYLCAKHSSGNLSPTDPLEYADADRWISWQGTTLWPPMREILLGLVRTEPGKRDHKRLATLVSAVTKHWQVIEAACRGAATLWAIGSLWPTSPSAHTSIAGLPIRSIDRICPILRTGIRDCSRARVYDPRFTAGDVVIASKHA